MLELLVTKFGIIIDEMEAIFFKFFFNKQNFNYDTSRVSQILGPQNIEIT